MHTLICVLFEVIAVKMHDPSLIGEYHIDNKVPEPAAVLVGHVFFEILDVDRIDIGADIVHRAVFLPQRLLHNIEHYGENQVELLVRLLESVLLPGQFLQAVLNQNRVQAHIFHPFWKMF